MNNLELLKKLGFKTAHKKVNEQIDKTRKMHIAYQNYEFITPENVKKFNEILRKKTEKVDKSGGWSTKIYDKLAFVSIETYPEAPPKEVLGKMAEAVERGCFDTFEIAKIESVKEVEDPILFGKVNGCGDMFFIAQWDNDVTIEMIKEAVDGEAKKK